MSCWRRACRQALGRQALEGDFGAVQQIGGPRLRSNRSCFLVLALVVGIDQLGRVGRASLRVNLGWERGRGCRRCLWIGRKVGVLGSSSSGRGCIVLADVAHAAASSTGNRLAKAPTCPEHLHHFLSNQSFGSGTGSGSWVVSHYDHPSQSPALSAQEAVAKRLCCCYYHTATARVAVEALDHRSCCSQAVVHLVL